MDTQIFEATLVKRLRQIDQLIISGDISGALTELMLVKQYLTMQYISVKRKYSSINYNCMNHRIAGMLIKDQNKLAEHAEYASDRLDKLLSIFREQINFVKDSLQKQM